MAETTKSTFKDRALNGTKVLLGAAGVMATAGALLTGCGGKDRKVPLATAKQEAIGKYDKVFERSDAAGKFALQFLARTTIRQMKESDKPDAGNVQWALHFNNACLYNTAYDTDGGHISVNGHIGGLFVSGWVHGSGNIPATAIVSENASNPDLISVIP